MTVQAVLAVSAVKSKATVKGETSEPPLPATPETPALPTFPDECDDDLPTSPAKKLRQETDETISVKANPTAMSSLFGDVYIQVYNSQSHIRILARQRFLSTRKSHPSTLKKILSTGRVNTVKDILP